jgi:NDP-sugar pyrophosphorylase family protein
MSKNKIDVAVIPAAGKGNRILELPLTRILPKPMLPLVNRPIMEHIIRQLRDIGVRRVYPIVSFKKEVFKDYFGDGSDFGVEVEYIECPDPEKIGRLADGIYLAKDLVREPFIVVLGDDLTLIGSPEIFVRTFFRRNALAIEAVVRDNDLESVKRTCSVRLGGNNRILDIIEKPKKPKWKVRGCGIYVFDPVVFKYIEKTPFNRGRGGKDITKTIQIMAKKTKRVYGVPVDVNININTLEDLHKATLLILAEKEKLLGIKEK